MRGVGGHTGWFWLFLLEGILTCLIALVVCVAQSEAETPEDRLTGSAVISLPAELTDLDEGYPMEESLVYGTGGVYYDQCEPSNMLPMH